MIEQRTDEWLMQRVGKITASRFCDAMKKLKNGNPSEARLNYVRELVFEVLSGNPKQSVQANALKWGSEIEQYAREAYELKTGELVTLAEFVTHHKHPFIGCSPDGLIGEEGGIEIKCPHNECIHIQTLVEGMPVDHIPQIQGAMFVTGRKWWDFISYDPRQAPDYRLYIQRIHRDEDYIQKLEKELLEFWRDVQMTLEVLKKFEVQNA